MDKPDRHLLLGAIFYRLRARGLRLSIKSYLEAMEALELYPEPFDSLRGVGGADASQEESLRHIQGSANRVRDREELVWLCQTLWARSEDEGRIIRTVISQETGLPDPLLTAKLCKQFASLDSDSPPPFKESARPVPEKAKNQTKSSGENKTDLLGDADGSSESLEAEEPAVRTDLENQTGGGAELPSIRDGLIPGSNRFAMQPEPLVPALWLTGLWRRMFTPSRSYDRSRIDMKETVRAAARYGFVLSPQFAVKYKNVAKLLLLMDASQRMQPWFDFEQQLRSTLSDASSRLSQAKIAYFSAAPGDRLYRAPTLREPDPLSTVLKAAHGSPLLIFGEAGTIGHRRPDLLDRLDRFLREATAASLKPIVWVNPMPESRWSPPVTAIIKRYPHTHCLPLSSESLLRAVDILRGLTL